MEQDVKKEVSAPGRGHTNKVLKYRKMPGAGYGQELSHALHQSEDYGRPDRHSTVLQIGIM